MFKWNDNEKKKRIHFICIDSKKFVTRRPIGIFYSLRSNYDLLPLIVCGSFTQILDFPDFHSMDKFW